MYVQMLDSVGGERAIPSQFLAAIDAIQTRRRAHYNSGAAASTRPIATVESEPNHPVSTAQVLMNSNNRFKLFLMMLLELFIWGAWFPKIFGYVAAYGLNFDSMQQSIILNAFPVAAMLAMFFGNQFADRHFAAERFLAVSHLIGGVSILALA